MRKQSRVLLLVAVSFVSLALVQTGSELDGTVTSKDGKPVAGVRVYGSRPQWPGHVEQETTDELGNFHLKAPGTVLHLSKKDFLPQAYVVRGNSPIQITLEASTHHLTAPICGTRKLGTKRIGWQWIRFDVPKHAVKILDGKWDTDYVRYLIKPKAAGESYLELWFGPYALSVQPDDKDFVNSISFSQRDIVDSKGEGLGMDSWGQLRNEHKWRQTVAFGGGSRYMAANQSDVILFDQIVNSLCTIDLPEDTATKTSDPQPKP